MMKVVASVRWRRLVRARAEDGTHASIRPPLGGILELLLQLRATSAHSLVQRLVIKYNRASAPTSSTTLADVVDAARHSSTASSRSR